MTDNSVLSELSYSPERGALEFKGVRYLLIRPETLRSVHQAAEGELGAPKAADLFFAGGFTGGKLSGERYKQSLGLTDAEAVEFMCRMGGEIGWGRFRLVELDETKSRLVVEVKHSPFAGGYYEPTQTGVCHLTRGVLSGLAAGLFGVEVRSNELQCLAKGDQLCRFEIEPAL
ncbi:MAG: V4R domain-containing protein [Anaerolineales bacterium]